MVRDSVRAFYDAYGWKKDERSGRYLGEILHEDLDIASQQYMHANEARYRKHFGGGRFFLDAGSGSEPRREMSRHYSRHVCVDISLVGLREARQQLREAGLYVVADLAALPFPESCFDGVLASHCLYHIEKDLQPVVLWEFFRVAKPKRNIVVFYHSPHNLLGFLGRLVKTLRGARRRVPARAAPPLYFYGHSPRRLAAEFPAAEVTCLRILKRAETQILKRLRLLRPAIAACEFLERSFPHAMVSVGEYAAIRIQKRRGGNLVRAMKVLHVVHNSHPDLTGGAIRTRCLVEAQARMGVQPVVLSGPFQPPLDAGQSDGVEWFGGIPYYRSYNGADPARFMAAKPWWERAAKMGALVPFVRRICQVAREERADLIHAHSLFFCGLAAIAAGRRLGLPVIYEVRSLIGEGIEGGGKLAPFAYRWLERMACRLASHVVVISEGLREEMLRRGVAASRITVAGNGVDREAHRPPERPREAGAPFVLGYIGTLVSYEGLYLLIDAVALLAAAHPELRLRVVGDGPARPALEDQVRRLGLEDMVCFTGRVEHNDIAAQYGAIDLFVLPRRPSRLTDAVTPLKPLEIMAHAKPLLAGDCGGHRELIVDGLNGALFPAASAGTLARRIEQMMADREGLARLGRQAREWVRANRSWETQCRPVLELYEELLERQRAAGRGVLLVAPKPRPAPTGGVETGVALILRSSLLQKHRIAVWDRGRLRCRGPWPLRAAGQLLHFVRFAAHLAAHRPRSVHIKTSSGVNFFQSAIYALISRGLGRHAVMELHSGEFEGWYVSRSGIGRWAIRRALGCFSELVALSQHWRSVLARLTPSQPIQVVPNAVEIPELAERRPHSSVLRVLTIATLGAYKGHYDILAAAAQLRHRPIRFILAGPDETDGRGEGGVIRRWAMVLDLANTVKFAGPVGPQEKWKLLSEVDVFLLPSRAEGMPNAVLEAMAAGLPVVATPVGALPEMLGGGLGGRFVPVGDSEALANALLELLADPAWREKMGRWNRARAEARYSIRRVEHLLDALYAGRPAEEILCQEAIEHAPKILAAGGVSK